MAAVNRRVVDFEPVDQDALLAALDDLYLQAADFVTKPRVTATFGQWLSKAEPIEDDGEMASAIMLAMDLEIFTPSFGGATAFARLGRRQRLDGAAAAALAAIGQACFTPMRIRSVERGMSFVAENLFTGATIEVFDTGVHPDAVAAIVATRLAPLPGGGFGALGPVTPLYETSLAVALEFVRPGKRMNDQRCAAAVYRHVVRHGNPMIRGFNDSPLMDDEAEVYAPTGSDEFAVAWLKLDGALPPEALIEEIRAAASVMSVLEVLFKCHGAASIEAQVDLAAPFRWIAELQMETLQRRAEAGSGEDPNPFDTIVATMDEEIASRDYPPGAKALFVEMRTSFERAKPRQADDELTR